MNEIKDKFFPKISKSNNQKISVKRSLTVLWIRIRIQVGLAQKIAGNNLIFWCAGCSLLRAEGFFWSFDVLYRGLGKSKLQLLIKKRWKKKFQLYFFPFLSLKPWIRSRNWIHLKCWIRIRFYESGSTRLLSIIGMQLNGRLNGSIIRTKETWKCPNSSNKKTWRLIPDDGANSTRGEGSWSRSVLRRIRPM